MEKVVFLRGSRAPRGAWKTRNALDPRTQFGGVWIWVWGRLHPFFERLEAVIFFPDEGFLYKRLSMVVLKRHSRGLGPKVYTTISRVLGSSAFRLFWGEDGVHRLLLNSIEVRLTVDSTMIISMLLSQMRRDES